MQREALEIQADDGERLFAERWRPEGPSRGLVVVSHGWAEHVGRYASLAASLTTVGLEVFGADHRGMGRSGGSPGDIDDLRVYVSDLKRVIAFATETRPGLPRFVYGHGLGALIELLRLRELGGTDPDGHGSVLASPLLSLAMAPPVRDRLSRGLFRWLAPHAPRAPNFPVAELCRDRQASDDRVHDARCVLPVTPAWSLAIRAGMREVRETVSTIREPSLWLVATGDRFADHRAALRCFERLYDPRGDEQQVRSFSGAFHELHQEPPALRSEVFEVVRAWIEGRLGEVESPVLRR